jgi:DNA-binding transcriptional ArsR family regulator
MINIANQLHACNPHLKIYLCNRTVAHIFATERLLKWPFISMRRDVFQAIADPTRRAILSLLALQAMTPNTLADHFDSSRQAISKHIKILTECQLITQQQTGREIYYYFNAKKLKEVDKWLEQFRAMWDTRFTQLETLLKTIKNKKP